MRTVENQSTLAASFETVWRRITTMRGVNDELGPWIRMTYPREAESLNIAAAPTGVVLFHSWILFRGVIPFDLHHLRLDRIEADGFVEESTSWLQRRWRHERRVRPDPDGRGCVLTDRVTFEPRLRFAEPIVSRIVAAVFRHRHRQLVVRFGSDFIDH